MLYLSTSDCALGTLDKPPGTQVDAEVFLPPDLSLAGEAGASPGSFATTPQGTYQDVAQSPTQGMGNAIDALMSGSKWSGTDAGTARTVVTYSFVNAQSSFSYAGQNNFTSNVSTFSEADKALTRTLLGKIEAVCNVEFVEVADNATECGVLRYGYSPQPNVQGYAGFAYFPSSSAMGGDIWIGANQAACTWDFYRPNLILHETLHAIGLKHPFEAGAVLSTAQDIVPNTVMSNSTVAGGSSSWMSAYPSEPMPMDVAALQCLYGAAPTNTGDTTYDLSGASFQGFSVLWDAGGNDTLDAGALAHSISLDLRCGVMSDLGNSITAMAKAASGATLKTTYTGTLSIAAGATIENAMGTAFADSIGGNEADNAVSSGAGNDRLEGRGGNDVLDGGDGFDTAMVEAARDGYSISKSGASYTLSGGATGTDVLTSVERIAFTDANIALDLDGNAGIVAKIIGAVLGASYVQDASYVGVGLAAIDNGMSATALMEAALNARLGGGHSSHAAVELLLHNICGVTPSDAYIDSYADLINYGSTTEGALGVLAMEHPMNLANIDLVGLAAHGIDYV